MNANPLSWSFRAQFLFGFAVCVSLLAYAVFAQYGQLFEPCPLCIFQRVAMAATAAVGLVGGQERQQPVQPPSPGGAGCVQAAGTGAAIAGRHVWLQHLPPDRVPECGPGLSYMIDVLPSWAAVVRKVLQGSGECAKVDWTFLGFSMPEWTLLCFVLLAAGALTAGFRRR